MNIIIKEALIDVHFCHYCNELELLPAESYLLFLYLLSYCVGITYDVISYRFVTLSLM